MQVLTCCTRYGELTLATARFMPVLVTLATAIQELA
jgi:hypothetical protein